MPNRKTFDEREKYDHSGRPLDRRQKNDLKADVSEESDTTQRDLTPGSRPAGPRAAPGRTKTGRS